MVMWCNVHDQHVCMARHTNMCTVQCNDTHDEVVRGDVVECPTINMCVCDKCMCAQNEGVVQPPACFGVDVAWINKCWERFQDHQHGPMWMCQSTRMIRTVWSAKSKVYARSLKHAAGANTCVQSDARTNAPSQFNRWIISGEIAEEIEKLLNVGYADRDSVEQVSTWLAAHMQKLQDEIEVCRPKFIVINLHRWYVEIISRIRHAKQSRKKHNENIYPKVLQSEMHNDSVA